MTIRIKDGTGKGYDAAVTSLNQLFTYSESIPSEGYQARLGNAFIIHAECHTAAAATGALLAITNNDQNYELEVTRIYIDPHTITPTDLILTQVFEPTLASGTDVSSTAIVQKNRGVADTFDLTVKISDSSADLTYTGGTQYHAFPAKTMTSTQRNMQLTNIIRKNQTILWGWKTRGGGNATDGEIVSLSIDVVRRAV